MFLLSASFSLLGTLEWEMASLPCPGLCCLNYLLVFHLQAARGRFLGRECGALSQFLLQLPQLLAQVLESPSRRTVRTTEWASLAVMQTTSRRLFVGSGRCFIPRRRHPSTPQPCCPRVHGWPQNRPLFFSPSPSSNNPCLTSQHRVRLSHFWHFSRSSN